MDLDGSPVFVAAVHAVSPYPDDTARWSAELDELADWLGELDGPAVVAGDFNATFDHPQFRDVLATGYRDAAEQVGRRLPADVPGQPAADPAADHDRPRPRQAAGSSPPTSAGCDVDDTDHEALVVATLAVPPPRA